MISIAMTTYNGEKFLRRQLDSVINQSLDFSELIICDDNSTDSTLEILYEYAKIDNRIKISINQRNIGFARNFEKAIKLCKCEYIALCDQDDVWMPDHLKILFENMENNDLICGYSQIIDSKENEKNILFHSLQNYDFRGFHPNIKTLYFLGFYHGPFQGASMLMKKEFAQKILPISKGIRFHDVWAVYVACLHNSFKFVNKTVTKYRLHENNASGKYGKSLRIKTLLGHLVSSRLKRFRNPMIIEARKRYYKSLCPESKHFLDISEAYMSNSDSLIGRLKNLWFEIKNFNSIYGIR